MSDVSDRRVGETLPVVLFIECVKCVKCVKCVNLGALNELDDTTCCVDACGGGSGGGGATYSAVTERARRVSVGDVGTDAAAEAARGAELATGRSNDVAKPSSSCRLSAMSGDGDPCDLGM